MNTFLIVLVGLIIIVLIARTKGKTKPFTLGNLKNEAQKAFPRLKIKERNGQILICEIDHRGEFNELVFIKLNSSSQKRVENKGRFLVASYPYVPSRREMQKDFGFLLNKY